MSFMDFLTTPKMDPHAVYDRLSTLVLFIFSDGLKVITLDLTRRNGVDLSVNLAEELALRMCHRYHIISLSVPLNHTNLHYSLLLVSSFLVGMEAISVR